MPVAVLALLLAALQSGPFEAPVRDERLRSGVHLGGIGCGKLELHTDLAFGGFTGNGNWDRPIAALPLSFFAVVSTDADGRRVCRALCGGDPAGIASAASIRCDGRFGRADAVIDDDALPCQVTLRAVASWQPGEVDASSVPGALFRLDLRRRTDKPPPQAIELWLAFESVVGCGGTSAVDFTDRTGTRASARAEGTLRGIELATDRSASGPARNVLGTFAIAANDARAEAIGIFNAAGDGADLARCLESGAPPLPLDTPGVEGAMHPGALLRVPLTFDARGRARADFAIAWHAPHLVTQWDDVDHGKAYQARFADAFAVARHLLIDADAITAASGALERSLRDSTLPEWLVRKLLNNLGPMVSSSVLTADGFFGCIESPVTMRGALGTMDQRLSSHAAWTLLFPTLDERELRTFAALQLKEGAIPHFSGNFNLALPSALVPYGLTPWPDLAASFALQVDGFARWSGDRAFLADMQPHVARALRLIGSMDRDGDGIPEGGSTFDNRPYKGAFAYTASVYLAALRAGARLARGNGDAASAAQFDASFLRARDGMMTTLWNGRWFDKAFDPYSGERSSDCNMAQLAGEFRAGITGLGPLLDPEITGRAVRSMLELNGAAARMPLLDVAAGGVEAWNTDCWTQYTETYLLMLAMQQGHAGAALDWLRRMAEAQRYADRDPFNVALVYDSQAGTRRWGDAYMTSTASWFLPRVLSGFDADLLGDQATLILDPQLPAADEDFRLPIHNPHLQLVVSGELPAADRQRHFRIEAKPGTRPTAVRTLSLGLPIGTDPTRARLYLPASRELLPATVDPSQPGRGVFTLRQPLPLADGACIDLYLIDLDAAPLRIAAAAPARSHGAAVWVDASDDPAAIRLRSDVERAWPVLVQIDRALGEGSTGTGDTLLPLTEDPLATTRTWLALVPGPGLDAQATRWLANLQEPYRAEAAALLQRNDASRSCILHARGTPTLADPAAGDRAPLAADLATLRARVHAERDEALRRDDLTRVSDLTPIALDLAYLGNPLSDANTRLRVTAQAADGRYRIDHLHLALPPGIEVLHAPRPAGLTLPVQRAYQASVLVRADAATQWRRSNVAVTLDGVIVGDVEVPFSKRVRLSVGYDFVRRFLTCGVFAPPPGADPLSTPFAPELGGEPGGSAAEAAGWRPLDTIFQGVLDLRLAGADRHEQAAAYAAFDVHAEQAMPARLLVGSGGGLRIWHDRSLLWDHPGQRFGTPAQDQVDLLLHEGANRLLFKVAGAAGVLSLLVEVVDRNGESIPGLRTTLPGDAP